MMRYYYIVLIFLLVATGATAQALRCGTKAKGPRLRVDSATAATRWQQYRTTSTYPLIIRLYVVIFANDDGSGLAAEDSLVLNDIAFMRSYFAPHDICFVLSGIEHANSTDLNTQDVDNEEDELEPYLRTGYLCMFIHRSVMREGEHIGGFAYNIPGTYLSVDGDDLDNQRDILAHEAGHCFGLYHTFEDAFGKENVNRNGGCRDCEDDGDLLCDTPADLELDDMFLNSTTCEYNGSLRDECGSIYQMAPTNIMSYWNPSCRDHFTTAQGGRARDFIIDPLGDLQELIAADFRSVTNIVDYSSGFVSAVARVIVSFESLSFTTSGSARLYSSAGIIDVKPGTTLNPGASGVAELRPNPFCQ
jgi:hypothetical protein